MEELVKIAGLKKYFPMGKDKDLRAVDDISFSINSGETLGLVGESGCGKSTLGRTLVRMYEQTEGHFYFENKEVPNETQGSWRKDFAKKVQMIFQDPYASLNPRMTVGDIVAEGPVIHGLWKGKERIKACEWLERVGLSAEHASRFPHEFSGGQRQRIGIARALAVNPKFVVCDEPISALDVSIQAQVINLLQDLQKELNLTYLFIAHGLDMVRHISTRMAVMYLGKIVEIGNSDEVFKDPLHPYSKALIASNPRPDPHYEKSKATHVLKGELASPVGESVGCPFANRCPYVMDICRHTAPELKPRESSGRPVACHLY